MKRLVTVLLCGMLASCGQQGPHNTGVYMLLDTSGTYREELVKAEQIIRYTLARLDEKDTFAVARIDTGSFSERDIVAKASFDDRPSAVNRQKRVFAQQVADFAVAGMRMLLVIVRQFDPETPAVKRSGCLFEFDPQPLRRIQFLQRALQLLEQFRSQIEQGGAEHVAGEPADGIEV